MSVLIKGMEMPDKATTIVVFPEGKVRVFRQDIDHDEWLTAIEVPPHGDLIDRDKLPIECITFSKGKMYRAGTDVVFVKDILDAPTIIPAEPCKEKGK